MDQEQAQPRGFRFRLGTLLVVVAILALLLVVVVQQVQMERMRRSFAAERDERARAEDEQRAVREFLEHRLQEADPVNPPSKSP